MKMILFKEQNSLKIKFLMMLSLLLTVFTVNVQAQSNFNDSSSSRSTINNAMTAENNSQNTNQNNPSNISPSNNIGSLWQNWNLLLITLDKTDKPANKAEISLFKPVTLKKEKGPEISIQEISLEEQNTGRWIRIQCGENVITQKFESPAQLKGWAVQFSCNRVKYYFIINFSGSNSPIN